MIDFLIKKYRLTANRLRINSKSKSQVTKVRSQKSGYRYMSFLEIAPQDDKQMPLMLTESLLFKKYL